MAGDIFDEFDYSRLQCPCCGAEFDEEDIDYDSGQPACPECGEILD